MYYLSRHHAARIRKSTRGYEGLADGDHDEIMSCLQTNEKGSQWYGYESNKWELFALGRNKIACPTRRGGTEGIETIETQLLTCVS